jgi:hypothetical protein
MQSAGRKQMFSDVCFLLSQDWFQSNFVRNQEKSNNLQGKNNKREFHLLFPSFK